MRDDMFFMDEENFDEDLCHYGVMGMKWGHRKGGTAVSTTGGKKPVPKKKNGVGKKIAIGAATTAALGAGAYAAYRHRQNKYTALPGPSSLSTVRSAGSALGRAGAYAAYRHRQNKYTALPGPSSLSTVRSAGSALGRAAAAARKSGSAPKVIKTTAREVSYGLANRSTALGTARKSGINKKAALVALGVAGAGGAAYGGSKAYNAKHPKKKTNR